MVLYNLYKAEEWLKQQKCYKYLPIPYNIFPLINIDLEDREDSYVLISELPGVEPDNITVEYETGLLHIIAFRNNLVKENNNDTSKNLRKEIIYGEMKRSIQISQNIDSNKISAYYSNGMLRIDLAKSNDFTIEGRKFIKVN